MINKGLFTSNRETWRTPKAVYSALDAEFHFDFDPCPVNPQFDGLDVPWGKSNFINPPYGRQIGKWVERAAWMAFCGATCVMLIPSRTDTSWWHEYVMKAKEIRFIRGRLHFDDGPNGAPFPSAVVVFKP